MGTWSEAPRRIEVRVGTPNDAKPFADLALMASEPLFRIFAGSRALRVLEGLFRTPGNVSSYDKAFFATVDGVPQCMLQGFDWEQYRAERAYTDWVYFTKLGSRAIWTLICLAYLPRWFGKPKPGEYYITHLATYPEFRGLGLATQLLSRAEQVARDSNCAALSLDADLANTLAMPLYLKIGFRIEEQALVKAPGLNLGRLCRMRKPLV